MRKRERERELRAGSSLFGGSEQGKAAGAIRTIHEWWDSKKKKRRRRRIKKGGCRDGGKRRKI